MRLGKINVGLFILGAFALVVGIISVIKVNTYTPAQAVITRVESYYDYNEQKENHTAYVDYTVDGKEYKDVALDFYKPGYDEGVTVDIKYNPDNPAKITGTGLGFSIYLVVIGGVLVCVSVLRIINGKRS